MKKVSELLHQLFENFPEVLTTLGVLAGGLLGGFLVKVILFALLRAYCRRKPGAVLAPSVARHLGRATAFFLPVLVLSLVLPLAPLGPAAREVMRRILEISLISTFAWVLARSLRVAQDVVRHHYQIEQADNLRVRKLLTQLQFVQKVVLSLIILFAIGLILMSFATVRKLGAGLLTSAGILSVIVGLAAQRSISNFLAGFQIAFTQPIRIDDVLVVEGEWGRVEEITFTYVVVRIWDERRLVLPLNYFIEKPFQNWSRTTSQLIGTVFLYVDYTLPVEAVRQELQHFVAQQPLWDQRVCALQVTDSKEKTMELRLLVSAADAGRAFDLRCAVREHLVGFIQRHYPTALPRTRLDGPTTVG
ncbi:mechanosensitive ion channel [Hymenobacter sp. ASUV-10]|uniref:Mechanosensitive ion channel n=1 Tax=Hymenobacter aranciens TaxID=3063996 RepID=A0ABT9BEL6_9BACT|nr:mechanosensitive ion channel domain-containing protein [Hymenobacter sp. ASUV-10]MDO7876706.1 mechanosensitive ion channel [Hymenobacter sp. ASUV-10]